MSFGINKSVPRNLTKDIIVMIACLLFYAALIVVIFTPMGAEIFEKLKSLFPFDQLVEGTFSDVNRFLGLIFKSLKTDSVAGDVVTEAYSMSLATIFLDLCKLMLSSFLQSIIFLLFSWCFLYSSVFTSLADFGEVSVGSIMDGGLLGKRDIIYYINHTLLMGISVLVGVFSGSYIMDLVEKYLVEATASQPSRLHFISFALFSVMLILFVVYYMIKSKKILHVTISFNRALTKTIAYNIIPEMLTVLITNVIIVFLFRTAAEHGFSIITIVTLGVYLLWLWLENALAGLATMLFNKDLPYCGKYCPFSGFLLFPATISSMVLLYLAFSTELMKDASEQVIHPFPFLVEWFEGENIGLMIINDFSSSWELVVNLVFLSTLAAVLQYISSSYFPTLFSQIVGRVSIILGIQLCIMFLTCGILYFFFPSFVNSIEYPNVMAFLVLMIYFIFFILQPHIAFQGILTAAGFVLVQSFLSVPHLFNSGNVGKDTDNFIVFAVAFIALNVLFSLLQNIIAVIEKRHNKAKKGVEKVVEAITK